LKIIADTNILISAFLYPNGINARALLHVSQNHELYLSDYNVSELHDVIERKFSDRMPDVDAFLAKFAYELIIAPISPEKLINDPKDAPILNAAIIEDIDLVISSDNHFYELSISRPAVKTATDFLKQEGFDLGNP
jgi:putative PIN family toxin of toxin-antitoxin system